jgi:tetratricopeptide (TPR) repeat protein
MRRLVFFGASFSLIFLLVVFRSFFRPPDLLPGDPQILATGYRFYQSGDYRQAAQVYQQGVDQGVVDAALYYNLGNAYYKLGDYGRAILNYRRAQNLSPRDADIRANLSLARSQTTDRVEGTDDDLGIRISRIGDIFSQDELALISLGLWLVFVILFIAYRWAQPGTVLREGFLYGWAAVLILLALSGFALTSRVMGQGARQEAVILAPQVEVTSAPGGGTIQFVLHAGTEVSVLEERTGWRRISLAGENLQGWLPYEALEIISP